MAVKLRVLICFNVIVLISWMLIGIQRAMFEPSWLCILDGLIVAINLYAMITNIQLLKQLSKRNCRLRRQI